MPNSPLINIMCAAAEKAGQKLRRDFGELENLQVSRKGQGDFVTNADLRTETLLREELEKARPGYGFLLEESGAIEGSDKTHRWIIDPIDGTNNFLHGVPFFCISIALEREGTLVAGVIYNPISDELFTAERGQGAFLHNRRLRVSGRTRLDEALIECATSVTREDAQKQAAHFTQVQNITPHIGGLRSMGSAALELAYVAAGRLDAMWARNLSAWDIAGGIVLIREAGGMVSDFSNRDKMFETREIIASNSHLHASLHSLLS